MRCALCFLLLTTCRLYAPVPRDCALHCSERDECPQGTTCAEGYCRVPGATTECDCKAGEQRSCGGGLGECRQGTEQCNADGSWGACVGEVRPSLELCDNKDNNCDGVIDNSVTDAPPCPLRAGVCATAVKRCVGGRFEACVTADYGLDYQQAETLCDTLDNDCDGVADAAPEVQLVSSGSGEWTLLGYPGGFALVTQDASDVVVDRYDSQFMHLSTARTTRGPSPRFVARNDGAEVYVVLIQGGNLEARKISLDGTIVTLAAASVSDATEPWQVGVSREVLVATYRSASMGARSVEWSLDGGAAVARRLDVPDALSITSVFASLGGRYVVWRGDTASGAITQVRTSQTDQAFGVGRDPGPQSAIVIELPQGQLASVFSEVKATSSGVYLVQNLVDAGTQTTVRTSSDPGAIGPVHATLGAGGALMAWPERSAVSLASQLAVGEQSVFTIRTLELDAGVVSAARVAAIGERMLGLAVERGGTIYARRVCSP